MKAQKWMFCFMAFAMLQLGIVLPLFAAGYAASDIALTPGNDASELNFAWVADGSGSCAVQIAEKGMKFEKSDLFSGTMAKTAIKVQDVTAYSYCEVTVKGLKNQQEYTYQLGDNQGQWSQSYQYSTEDTGNYGFVYLADAQIGASMGRRPTPEKIAAAIVNDTKGWAASLNQIINKFPKAAFIMSAGDQIETPGDERQWSGFLSPAELTSIPLAPTPAAHDELGSSGRGGAVSSYAFDYHFNLPNESDHSILAGDLNECPPPGAPPGPPPGASKGADKGADDGGPPPGPRKECTPEYEDRMASAGDYYFTYGDALYIVLNMDSEDYEQHDAFVKSAVDANPQAKWNIAMWHYTIYTSATRHTFIDRTKMAAIMEKQDIDLVLQGHDHTYCRTYPMLKDVPQTEKSVDPAAVVYLTANSASGSKYYSLNPDASTLYFVAASSQESVPTFSYIDVDASSLKITTYKTGTMDVIDTYTMKK